MQCTNPIRWEQLKAEVYMFILSGICGTRSPFHNRTDESSCFFRALKALCFFCGGNNDVSAAVCVVQTRAAGKLSFPAVEDYASHQSILSPAKCTSTAPCHPSTSLVTPTQTTSQWKTKDTLVIRSPLFLFSSPQCQMLLADVESLWFVNTL